MGLHRACSPAARPCRLLRPRRLSWRLACLRRINDLGFSTDAVMMGSCFINFPIHSPPPLQQVSEFKDICDGFLNHRVPALGQWPNNWSSSVATDMAKVAFTDMSADVRFILPDLELNGRRVSCVLRPQFLFSVFVLFHSFPFEFSFLSYIATSSSPPPPILDFFVSLNF